MLLVYSDFNCPFCFAQHERIKQLGLENDVEWRFIEHAPHLSSKNKSEPALRLLQEEFKLIRKRAKEISIEKPSFCVNTRLAILSYVSIFKNSPDKANDFIGSVFKAYWQNGQDISNTVVLRNILGQYQINKLEFHEKAQNIQQHWQKSWLEGDYDRRIPAISTLDDRTLLGLQHKENILNFARNHRFDNESGLICNPQGKAIIAQLYLGETNFEQALTRSLSDIYQYDSLTQLIESADRLAPEIVIINFSADQERNFQTIEILKKPESPFNSVPIIYYFDETTKQQSQTLAFSLGAIDIITASDNPDLVFARLQRRLQDYRQFKQLEDNASIDSLTEVCNKRQLNIALERFWRIGCIKKIPLAILMVDIDDFKKYNDHFGHIKGDDSLIKVAEILKSHARRSADIVARFGGEEFVMVMLDISPEDCFKIAEDIRLTVESADISQAPDAVHQNLTVSIGICTTMPHADYTPNQVIELADKQLYLSKNQGKNKVNAMPLDFPVYA